MREITLRIASDDDLPALAALRWRLKVSDDALPRGEDFALFAEAFIGFESAALARGDIEHWIADVDGAPVAAMSLVVVRKVSAPGGAEQRWGYLTNCYVTAEHRNAGVGSRMLEAIQSRARDEALELLIVWPSDRAFPFYERSGFQRPDDLLVWTAPSGD
jgi:ribosomal protein S18 acetylase RimI-like enzyme